VALTVNRSTPNDAHFYLEGAPVLSFDASGEAGTAPDDPTSVLRLLQPVRVAETVILRFHAQSSRYYVVEKTSTLGPEARWQPIGQELYATISDIIEVSDSPPTGLNSAFYRLRVSSGR
jgi:hypothetical protein